MALKSLDCAMESINTGEKESEYLQIFDVPLERHLEKFHEVKGYKASAFTNHKGVVIAFDTLDEGISIDGIGNLFCGMFNYTDTEMSKNGFAGCIEMQMLAGENIFLIFSSRSYSLITTRLIVLLKKEGSFSLARIKANNVVESLMNTITWTTDKYLLAI